MVSGLRSRRILTGLRGLQGAKQAYLLCSVLFPAIHSGRYQLLSLVTFLRIGRAGSLPFRRVSDLVYEDPAARLHEDASARLCEHAALLGISISAGPRRRRPLWMTNRICPPAAKGRHRRHHRGRSDLRDAALRFRCRSSDIRVISAYPAGKSARITRVSGRQLVKEPAPREPPDATTPAAMAAPLWAPWVLATFVSGRMSHEPGFPAAPPAFVRRARWYGLRPGRAVSGAQLEHFADSLNRLIGARRRRLAAALRRAVSWRPGQPFCLGEPPPVQDDDPGHHERDADDHHREEELVPPRGPMDQFPQAVRTIITASSKSDGRTAELPPALARRAGSRRRGSPASHRSPVAACRHLPCSSDHRLSTGRSALYRCSYGVRPAHRGPGSPYATR
jgi:hypothetical protein